MQMQKGSLFNKKVARPTELGASSGGGGGGLHGRVGRYPRRLSVSDLDVPAPGCPKGRDACARVNTAKSRVAGPAAGR